MPEVPWPPRWTVAPAGPVQPRPDTGLAQLAAKIGGAVATRDGPRIHVGTPRGEVTVALVELAAGRLLTHGGEDPGPAGRLAAALLYARTDVHAAAAVLDGPEGALLAPLLEPLRTKPAASVRTDRGSAAAALAMTASQAVEALQREVAP